MIPVEVCIHTDAKQSVTESVAAAATGGATTVELCAAMELDGLTPSEAAIAAARRVFDRPGLMVMIRPQPGGFVYDAATLAHMLQQIEAAARRGADGVVFGVLRQGDDEIDEAALARLCKTAQSQGLKSTFHRAFDATPAPVRSLETLIVHGVDRVLTSGTPWSSGRDATQGLAQLQELVAQADGRIEVVIGGGVSPTSARRLVAGLPHAAHVSLHAYSGVLTSGIVTAASVGALVDAAAQEK